MVTLRCAECGRAFERKASAVRKRQRRGSANAFCSSECVYKSPLRRALIGSGQLRKESPARQLSPTEAAWLAGFVDGEGCLVLSRVGDRFNTSLEVSNTDRRLLARCRELANVGAVYNRPRVRSANHRPQFMWSVSARADLFALLPQIIPHLVGKAQEASAVVAYCDRRIRGVTLDETDDALCEATKRRTQIF